MHQQYNEKQINISFVDTSSPTELSRLYDIFYYCETFYHIKVILYFRCLVRENPKKRKPKISQTAPALFTILFKSHIWNTKKIWTSMYTPHFWSDIFYTYNTVWRKSPPLSPQWGRHLWTISYHNYNYCDNNEL